MTDLSPAARAVFDAWIAPAKFPPRKGPSPARKSLAAALRAAADQGATFYWDGCPVQAVTVGSLLTIANQLEAQ